MRVESGTIKLLRIFDAKGLDPIRVTFDDIEPSKGRITIECWGKAWASYWGGMGGRTISQFFQQCSAQYLIGNLEPGLQGDRYSADALMAFARKSIIGRRRGIDLDFDSLDKDEARELYDRVDELSDCETSNSCWQSSSLLTQLFGDEWFLYLNGRAVEPNPDYLYLSRIVGAVQEGIGLMQQEQP